MEILNFETYISDEGMIKIPENYSLEGMYADIEIKVKDKKIINETDINNFLDEWTGIISQQKIDDDKYNYIMEKYNQCSN